MTTTNRARPAPVRTAPRPTAPAPQPAARRAPAPLARPAPGPTIPKEITDKVVKQENAALKAGASAAVPKDRASNGVAIPATRRRPVVEQVAEPLPAVEEFEEELPAQESSLTGTEEFGDLLPPEPAQDEFSEAELAESELPPAPLEAELEPVAPIPPRRPAPAPRQPERQHAVPAARKPAPQHAEPATGAKKIPAAPTAPTARKVEPQQLPATKQRQPALQVGSRPGVAGPILKSDLLIPKILLCQGQSKLVTERKAFPGQIVKSPSGDIIGGIHELNAPAEAIELILLRRSQSWTIVEAKDNVFRRSEPRNDANDQLPWHFVDADGVECKRLRTVDTICLLTNDVINNLAGGGEVDEDGVPVNLDDAVLLPHAFSFKSTGLQAGKFISTVFAKVDAGREKFPNMLPYHFSVDVTVNQDSDGEHDYFVLEAYNTHKTDREHYPAAKAAFEMLQNSNIQIQDENDAEAEVSDRMEARPDGVGKAPRGQY